MAGYDDADADEDCDGLGFRKRRGKLAKFLFLLICLFLDAMILPGQSEDNNKDNYKYKDNDKDQPKYNDKDKDNAIQTMAKKYVSQKGENRPISSSYRFACFYAMILSDQPEDNDKDNYKDKDKDKDKTILTIIIS